jgi:hypothetical protein
VLNVKVLANKRSRLNIWACLSGRGIFCLVILVLRASINTLEKPIFLPRNFKCHCWNRISLSLNALTPRDAAERINLCRARTCTLLYTQMPHIKLIFSSQIFIWRAMHSTQLNELLSNYKFYLLNSLLNIYETQRQVCLCVSVPL